jgi:hypothetical protein
LMRDDDAKMEKESSEFWVDRKEHLRGSWDWRQVHARSGVDEMTLSKM